MSAIWPGGEAIRVETNPAGQPMTFTWRGEIHPVEAVARRWRIDNNWWRLRAWRDYYKVLTEDGLLVIIYQDLGSRAWYLQRRLD